MAGLFGKIFGSAKAAKASVSGGFDIDAYLDEISSLQGDDERPERLPAWGLFLCAESDRTAIGNSWLGGGPAAPPGFVWPRDDAGRPLTFLAQIDLAELSPEPETGALPRGLPRAGALLVFVGSASACTILSPAEMAVAEPVPEPEDLPSLKEYGFFHDRRAFYPWRVTARPYLSAKGARENPFGDPLADPASWLINWGTVKMVAEKLGQKPASGLRKGPVPDQRTYAHLAAIGAWLNKSEAHPATMALSEADRTAAISDFLAIANETVPIYGDPPANEKLRHVFFNALTMGHGLLARGPDLSGMPDYLATTLATWVGKFREHRLLGHEAELINLADDLRGHDCLISIAADSLLNTNTEHECGFSVWVPREALDRGDVSRTKFVRHSSG